MVNQYTLNDTAWRTLIAPTAEELAAMARDAALSSTDAALLANPNHRAENIIRPTCLIFLSRIPLFDKKLRVTSGAALYAIVTANTLWTIQYEPIATFDNLAAEIKDATTPLELWLHLLLTLGESTFHKLDRLAKHIDIVEDAVFQGNERKMVEEISYLTRDTMDFRKIIRPQRDLFAQPPEHALVAPGREPWLSVNRQLQKIWETLESVYESIDQLSATNASLLQHKENELLRLLSLYSIITIPAWILITPFTPGQGTTSLLQLLVYWGIFIVLLVTFLIIVLRFRAKRVL